MRTTLDIEDDVLQAVKELAQYEKTTAGKVVSKLVRKALKGASDRHINKGYTFRNGVPVLPSRGEIITNEHINRIREEEGI
jgi:hypothetical protein